MDLTSAHITLGRTQSRGYTYLHVWMGNVVHLYAQKDTQVILKDKWSSLP